MFARILRRMQWGATHCIWMGGCPEKESYLVRQWTVGGVRGDVSYQPLKRGVLVGAQSPQREKICSHP